MGRVDLFLERLMAQSRYDRLVERYASLARSSPQQSQAAQVPAHVSAGTRFVHHRARTRS
jgi:hypothetical protein